MTQTHPTQTLTAWKKYTLPEEMRNPGKLPTPTSFGDEWAIVAQGAAKPGIFELIFMLIWLAIPVWLLLFKTSAVLSYGVFSVVPLLFIAMALKMLYDYFWSWRKYLQSQRFGSPILLINQASFHPGETLALSFGRDLKPSTEIGAGTLSARLVCVEVTRRTVGSDTTYEHVVHFEKDLGQQPTFGGQHQLRALWHANIPVDAQPSRIGADHWLVWELQVRQRLLGQLDETTSFLIPVTA